MKWHEVLAYITLFVMFVLVMFNTYHIFIK